MAVAEKPLYYLSIHEAQQLIKDRQLSPVDLTQARCSIAFTPSTASCTRTSI